MSRLSDRQFIILDHEPVRGLGWMIYRLSSKLGSKDIAHPTGHHTAPSNNQYCPSSRSASAISLPGFAFSARLADPNTWNSLFEPVSAFATRSAIVRAAKRRLAAAGPAMLPPMLPLPSNAGTYRWVV